VSGDENDEGREGDKRLQRIAASVRSGKKVEPVPVRELLGWFGAQRRGTGTNMAIRNALAKNDLRIEPEINAASLDGTVEFRAGDNRFDWMHHEIRWDLLTTRIANWIDQNPGVKESEIEAKAAAIEKLGVGKVLADEVDDIVRIHDRAEADGHIHPVPDREAALESAERDGVGREGYNTLLRVATSLNNGEKVAPITVRQLLRWFGTERRSIFTTFMIREALRINNIRTEPDFNRTRIGGTVEFQLHYKLTDFEASMWNTFSGLCLCFR
jgi:hypothetical protein